jgi:hypothetical protein
MEGPKWLRDAIYREEIRAAREMDPGEKLMAGPRMFEYECRVAAMGIRYLYPELTESQVQKVLTQRIEAERKEEERNWVRVPTTSISPRA